MGITERKARQKEELKFLILKEAWDIVKAEGWQSLSIRKIADAIEYSVPVVYTHFENKEAILLEFTKQGFHLLNQQLKKAIGSSKDSNQQIEAMAQAYWNFAFKQKEFYQIMFGLGIPACDKVNEVEEMKTMSDLFISVIENSIALGNNKKADKYLKFHTFWSILHGIVSIQMVADSTHSDEMNQMILEDAVAGFIKSLIEK